MSFLTLFSQHQERPFQPVEEELHELGQTSFLKNPFQTELSMYSLKAQGLKTVLLMDHCCRWGWGWEL